MELGWIVAAWAWRPVFNSPHPCKKQGMPTHAWNPSAGEIETGKFPLTCWPASLSNQKALGLVNPLSKKKKEKKRWRVIKKDIQRQPLDYTHNAYTHRHLHTHVHTSTYTSLSHTKKENYNNEMEILEIKQSKHCMYTYMKIDEV